MSVKLCILFDLACVTFQVFKLWVTFTIEVTVRSLSFVEIDVAFQPGLRVLNVGLALSILLFKSSFIPPVTVMILPR